jgi:hypothetical protein
MNGISKITPLAGYRLAVAFEDGVAGTIELESELLSTIYRAFPAQAVMVVYKSPVL